ncbi:hypothetical protein V5J34_004932 [Endozoicomonas sp. NE35]
MNILNVITDLQRMNSNDVLERIFVEGGYCYDFAYMMKRSFGGDVMYIPEDRHYVLKIDDVCYDITGIVDVLNKKLNPDEDA